MARQSQTISSRNSSIDGINPIEEWNCLTHGDSVDIWSFGSFLYTGYVDDRTDDGQVIWVIECETAVRRLFLRSDVTLYPS
jgi:hypothetical protein